MRRHTGQLGGHAQTHGAARWTFSSDGLLWRLHPLFVGLRTHSLSVCLHTPSVCTHCLPVCTHCLSVCTHCLSAHTGTAEKARGVRKTGLAVSQPYGDHAPSRFTRPPALPTAGCEAFVVVVLRGNPSGHYRGQSVSADLG